MPVCLVTFKGEGLAEKELRDIARYNVRNQIASVPGASVPMPFGGKPRRIQVYVDPIKMQAYDLSIMDVYFTRCSFRFLRTVETSVSSTFAYCF